MVLLCSAVRPALAQSAAALLRGLERRGAGTPALRHATGVALWGSTL